MLCPHRRCLLALLSLVVLVAAAAMRPQKASRHLFRVMLGVGGKEVQDWSGEVAVAGGEVTALGGWHFEGKDQVLGVRAWRCRTHNSLPTGARYPLDPATGQAPVVALQPAPVGIDMEVRGKAPVVALTLGQDELKFAAADVLLGNSKPFLGGSVQVERLPEVTQLRPPAPGASQNAHQDDYPAFWIRYKTGIQYLAWLVPWVVGIRRPAVSAFYVATGAFMFVVYTYWSRGTWWYANSDAVGDWKGFVIPFEIAAWISVCVVLVWMARAVTEERRPAIA